MERLRVKGPKRKGAEGGCSKNEETCHGGALRHNLGEPYMRCVRIRIYHALLPTLLASNGRGAPVRDTRYHPALASARLGKSATRDDNCLAMRVFDQDRCSKIRGVAGPSAHALPRKSLEKEDLLG